MAKEELDSDQQIKTSYANMVSFSAQYTILIWFYQSLEAQKGVIFLARELSTGVWKFCLENQLNPKVFNLLAAVLILGFEDADPSLMAWAGNCVGWGEGFRLDIGHPRQLLQFLLKIKLYVDKELEKLPHSTAKEALKWIGSDDYLLAKNIA